MARSVRVYAITPDSESAAPAPPAVAPNAQGRPRLSLVVLPFANMSGDPEQEYFVDGVTESLTTDLSRISGSFVIGRNTAFTYKGKPLDLKRIGRELNVRYVLEGSVQRVPDRMRVSVQLIDTESGNHLWAERFDKPLGDLFGMQDEIVARLAGAPNAELVAAEARRAERTSTPDSMDLYFQGTACLNAVGPALNGVVGRRAGMYPDYHYSDANKNSGITWDEATLKEYLRDPKAKVPGTKMVFPGLKSDEDIANVIAYLKQFGPDDKKI
jgi:TolB-like protein